MAAQHDKDNSQQRVKELEDEIENYRVYHRYVQANALLQRELNF